MAGRLKKWLSYKREETAARIKRRMPEPARRWIKRSLRLRNEILSSIFAKDQLTTPRMRDEYHRVLAGNVSGVLLKIMIRFYSDLGVDAQSAPLVKALQAFRRSLPTDAGDGVPTPAPVLIQFERAYALCEAGRASEAMSLFESVFRNQAARKALPYDPFVREAVVRSGEFIGRHYDKSGDFDAAIAIYRDILSQDRDGLIARRLMLLLSRRGDWHEVAELAETAISSNINLFPRLPQGNPYLAALETEFLSK